jgi:hypothetical protein
LASFVGRALLRAGDEEADGISVLRRERLPVHPVGQQDVVRSVQEARCLRQKIHGGKLGLGGDNRKVVPAS